MLEDLASNQAEKYATFWREFGRVLKEGIGEDAANRDRIAALLRFSSTRTDGEEQTVSLKDYLSRMQPQQDRIYYVTAETFLAAKNSPHLEVFRKRGVEVLLLSERVDEWLVAHLPEFEGKPLASVARGDLELGKLDSDEERKAHERQTGELSDLVRRLKEALGEGVKDVRVSARLTSSPSCLVADESDMGGNLARILKAAGQKVPEARPILEINPGHALVQRLKDEPAGADSRFGDWAHLLFEQALLAEGGTLEDPAGFVRRLNELMLKMSGAKSRIWTPGS
jgi:molecular chaperone HtpG